MRYHRLLISAVLLGVATTSFALEVFIDGLYWKSSEQIDWVLINNQTIPNQTVNIKSVPFSYSPGFKAGLNQTNNWNSRLYYSHYSTTTHDTESGNLVSEFLGGKSLSAFYQTGKANVNIHLYQIDADLSKDLQFTEFLIFRPMIGLRGAKINQSINTMFQGNVPVTENVTNNFWGVGPKAGLSSEWILNNTNAGKISILTDFAASFLWGNWKIHDSAFTNAGRFYNTFVPSRQLGALSLHGLIGIQLRLSHTSFKFGYEISDWFNQYQVFDDGTGTHNNDLIFQGLVIGISYSLDQRPTK